VHLSTFERRLRVQLARAEIAYLEASSLVRREDRQIRRHKLEGALSDAWQSYCEFVRSVCINSAIGCITSTGTVIVPSINPTTWQRASHIAIRGAAKRLPHPTDVNQAKRYEPTWGDATKIIDIVNALAPGNASTLISYFGGSLYGPPHCQLVRNACAHKNDQKLQEVRALSVQYLARPIAAPTDCLFWVDTVSGRPAFISWIDDMRDIATDAVK
jgi:hypothetical protein